MAFKTKHHGTFTPFQKALMANYNGGGYARLTPATFDRGVEDPLFEFMMDYFGPESDCTDAATALSRALTMREESSRLLAALEVDMSVRRTLGGLPASDTDLS